MANKTFSFKMNTSNGEWDNKVNTIKGLRALTLLGLKEAKELSESIADAYPCTYTTSLNVNPDADAVHDAIYSIKGGGVDIIDNSGPLRVELLDNVQVIAANAVSAGQYDIARVLLDLLESNQ